MPRRVTPPSTRSDPSDVSSAVAIGRNQTTRPTVATALASTLCWFAAALAVYLASIAITHHWASPNTAYFDHLARAWLEGRLYLTEPPAQADLTRFDGRWYVPFPPLASVLLLPFVATYGIEGISTYVFSAIWAALTVAIVWRLLNALHHNRYAPTSLGTRIALTLFMMVGTVFWHVALQGSVWFLSHVATTLFIALALYAAAARQPLWMVGILLGLALWGRPNVVFTALLPLALRADDRDEVLVARPTLARIRDVLALGTPMLVSIAGLAWNNVARFEDPLDFGYKNQNVSPYVREQLAVGQFHIRHVPRNVHLLVFGPPTWNADAFFPVPNRAGQSILLTSPLVFMLCWAWPPRRTWTRVGWLTLGLLLVPLLLYYNTGWVQFGYRFSLDFQIPLIMLLAAALPRMTPTAWTLLALSVFINVWGVLWSQSYWLE